MSSPAVRINTSVSTSPPLHPPTSIVSSLHLAPPLAFKRQNILASVSAAASAPTSSSISSSSSFVNLSTSGAERIVREAFGDRLPSLVIFDKDGTLICFHSMWKPWLEGFVARVESASGLPFQDSLFSLFGFNPKRRKFEPGLLAEGTMCQCKAAAKETIAERVGAENAEEIIDSCWEDCDTSSSHTLRATCDVRRLLSALKARGVKVAMCTADSRAGALGAIEKLGVADMFDIIVAGGDEDSKPKPDPHNALKICRVLGVEPIKAMMIGDTRADTEMGKNAGLGLTLGVLSGIGQQRDLYLADLLVNNVDDLFQLFPSLNQL